MRVWDFFLRLRPRATSWLSSIVGWKVLLCDTYMPGPGTHVFSSTNRGAREKLDTTTRARAPPLPLVCCGPDGALSIAVRYSGLRYWMTDLRAATGVLRSRGPPPRRPRSSGLRLRELSLPDRLSELPLPPRLRLRLPLRLRLRLPELRERELPL